MSVRNVDVSPSGKYEQICGYADIPDPSHPGELKVCLLHFQLACKYVCQMQTLLPRLPLPFGVYVMRQRSATPDM